MGRASPAQEGGSGDGAGRASLEHSPAGPEVPGPSTGGAERDRARLLRARLLRAPGGPWCTLQAPIRIFAGVNSVAVNSPSYSCVQLL